LALSINKDSGPSLVERVFYDLNLQAGSGSFPRLKRLYLCLEADEVDLNREVELVDLREKVKGEEENEGIAQQSGG
jgi:hypothetical protein